MSSSAGRISSVWLTAEREVRFPGPLQYSGSEKWGNWESALQTARPSHGSNYHVKWLFRLQYWRRKNSVLNNITLLYISAKYIDIEMKYIL